MTSTLAVVRVDGQAAPLGKARLCLTVGHKLWPEDACGHKLWPAQNSGIPTTARAAQAWRVGELRVRRGCSSCSTELLPEHCWTRCNSQQKG